MKKNYLIGMLLLLGILTFLFPTTSYSGFLIKLKNGGEIYADAYQIEGKHLILYLKGGSFRISRDEVQSITQTTVRIKDETEEKQPEKKVGDEREKPEEKKVGKEEAPQKPATKLPSLSEREIDQYKKRKAEIQARLDEAKKVYFDATDKEEKNKARKIMLSISDELYNLQEEVKKKNNGILPKWWQEE